MYRRVLTVLVALLQIGCATAGRSAYQLTPAPSQEVANEVLIDKPFEQVWDQLVAQLAKSFYVINNIDKASRLINVSYSSETPELYIDCGQSHREYRRGSESQDYDYPVAASSTYKYAGSVGAYPVTSIVERKTRLEGRANIYVAPEGEQTRVSVNVKYILTITVTGESVRENLLGTPVERAPIGPSISTVDFSTNQANKTNLGTVAEPLYFTCYSTGRLEQGILSYVKPE
jgi:hypothetical protein